MSTSRPRAERRSDAESPLLPASDSKPASGFSSAFRRLAADPWLQLVLALYALALVTLSTAPGDHGEAGFDLPPLMDPILLAVTLVALLWGRSRLRKRERRFWDLLALSWACWLSVEALYFLEPGLPFLSASFATDVLHVLYFFFFATALELRPHLGKRGPSEALLRRLESVASLAAFFGLVTYFAIVVLPEPLGLSLSFVQRDQGLAPSLLVWLGLDALLLSRLFYATRASRGRWSQLYALLTFALLLYALKDALTVVRLTGALPFVSFGLWYEAFLFLPAFLVMAAARHRHLTISDAGTAAAAVELEGRRTSFRRNLLVLYALLVPILHFLFYPLGLLDPVSRSAREVFCLVYVLVVGTMAWFHQRALAEKSRRAQNALREAEKRLFRSQRLEAVGRLAGGIAHDFNNYLTVIQGYGELLRERLSEPEAQGEIKHIQDAAHKATHLTRQLLAFGRRQVLRTEPLDLNRVVLETSELLASLLGEDVILEVDLDRDVGLARADLGQTEQVLVNLAINGRDAMKGGGTLSIRTHRTVLGKREAARLDVEPGVWAGLSVIDTGCGMTEEVLAQVFEPFFTTKEVGRGTGLGLSTVHGIVAQSGGAITLDSMPGEGTTVRVLLPIAEAPIQPQPAADAEPAQRSQAATLLLVEDEDSVRRLACRALVESGFEVLEASRGQEALSRHSAHLESIDMVITDVLMPGMGGVELAHELASRNPRMKVLFISGYPAETLREREAPLPPSVPLLEKPFNRASLVAEVRRVLDEPSPRIVATDRALSADGGRDLSSGADPA